MKDYQAPLEDMRFVLDELVDLDSVLALTPEAELSSDVVDAVLEEAGKFASGVFAPTDEAGQTVGMRWADGVVTSPEGYRDAYRQFVEGGWNALSCHPEFGGQGFPKVISAMVEEMWRSSNLAFTGCATLTRGAIEALESRGSDALKETYLPHLVSGEWTGTMNLTEPHAGSDVGAIRTRAEPQADGTYRLFGQKIFISFGEHDLSENIAHLVLARTPDAPDGVKGISLFLVPKFIPDADGNPGTRNDVHCAAIEKKMGQHGAPACVMLYGEGEHTVDGQPGAVGHLVGELNRGLEIMFIMMNDARFAVGLEGLAGSERAFQTARAYARERIQGAEAGGDSRVKVPIIRHPDVRRLLMHMKASTEGMRALTAVLAAALDRSSIVGDAEARQFVELMIPVYKGWNAEAVNQIASYGVQLHGGMGFMEETAASRHYRDVRIMAIYEGTTAIQANDLVGRKIARDRGEAAGKLVAMIRATAQELADASGLEGIGEALGNAADAVQAATDHVVAHYGNDPRPVLGIAVPVLHLFWLASIGWQLGRSALAARRLLDGTPENRGFLETKIVTAKFFAGHAMPTIEGLLGEIRNGSDSLLEVDEALI